MIDFEGRELLPSARPVLGWVEHAIELPRSISRIDMMPGKTTNCK